MANLLKLPSFVTFLYLPSFCPHSEKQKSLNMSGIILPPRLVVGQKGRVTVSIEGRRVDRVQTAWFLNNTPISDTSLTGRRSYICPRHQQLAINSWVRHAKNAAKCCLNSKASVSRLQMLPMHQAKCSETSKTSPSDHMTKIHQDMQITSLKLPAEQVLQKYSTYLGYLKQINCLSWCVRVCACVYPYCNHT